MSGKKSLVLVLTLSLILVTVAVQCGPAPEPEVVEKVVKETVVVEKEVEVVKEVVVTPTPEPPPPMPSYAAEFKNPDMWVGATYGEPESLDPAWTYESAGAATQLNLYEGVVAFKKSSVEEFVPALATDWEISEDGLTYVFNVREGVTFHEGGTLEPHDVAYSIQRGMLQDRADGPQWMPISTFFPGFYTVEDLAAEYGDDGACAMIQEAAVADDEAGTVTLNLGGPAPWLLQLMAQPFGGGALDMEWMVENGDWDGDCATWRDWHNPTAEETLLFDKVNGTGPFKLDHWTPGEEIVLVANEDYWRTEPIWEGGPSGPPSIKTAIIKLVEEWGTRLAMLETGDADWIEVDIANIAQIDPLVKTRYTGLDESAPAEELNPDGILKLFWQLPYPAMTPGMMNQMVNMEGGNPYVGSGKPDGNGIPPDFFSDKNVRLAFVHAFNYDAYIEDAFYGEAVQPTGPIIVGMMGWREDQPTYSYDPAKAEEYFKQAKMKDPETGEEVSVWDKGFYFQMTYNTGNDARRIAAEVIKQEIEALNPGFSVAVVNLPWPSYLAGRRAGKYPIAISGWIEDYHDPSNWVHPFMHSDGAYSRVQAFPEDLQARIDELIDKGVATSDPEERRVIYEELQQISYDEALDIFIYQQLERCYVQEWISGWYFHPMSPEHYFNLYFLSKVAP
ncbi:MAG: ABC transporter substrate-binding protein [Anaerolineales bacterium]|nr:MAG: ABC transporter substrate-binding protein [Anaerolineales bacterium]